MRDNGRPTLDVLELSMELLGSGSCKPLALKFFRLRWQAERLLAPGGVRNPPKQRIDARGSYSRHRARMQPLLEPLGSVRGKSRVQSGRPHKVKIKGISTLTAYPLEWLTSLVSTLVLAKGWKPSQSTQDLVGDNLVAERVEVRVVRK